MVERLDLATKGLTTIFVTHRGAMLRLADKVLVIDQGTCCGIWPQRSSFENRTIRSINHVCFFSDYFGLTQAR